MKKWIIGAIVIAAALVTWGVLDSKKPGELDAFARCISDKEITYYGAFWCPNCQKQNEMFGNSKQYLPYVECSTPDAKRQTQACIDAGIQKYPTWQWESGERTEGVMPLEEIAERSGCSLPNVAE